jgi:hypothetical protein
MFQRKLLSLILTLGLVCLLANQVQAETASSEKDPVISLVKTIIIRDYKGLKVQSDVYEVKQGDFLVKILRERGIIDYYDVKDEVLRLIQALNPEMGNPNLILPGQKLLLPIGPVEGLSDSEDEKPDQQAPKIPVIEHKVLYGERIAALLRRQGIPERLIFNEYINLVLALNPKIKNKDIIYPGQIIKLPQFEVMWTQAVIFKETAGEKISEPAPSPAAKKPEGKQAPEIREQKIPAVQAAAQPGSRTLINRVALGLIFARIGERFISTGQHFLPLKSGGQISLRASTFPILSLRSGHKIILDLDSRLPEQVIKLIRTSWQDYSIFQVKPREELISFLPRLFKECGYHRIYGKGEPVIFNSQAVKIKLQADWIIFPEEGDEAANKAAVLNLASSREQGTYPEAAAFLTEIGVTVIDFYPKGNLVGPEPMTYRPKTEYEVETIQSNGLPEFLQAVLDLIGQKYATNLSVPVIKSKETVKDFKLSVNVPLYFNRNGIDFMVRFEGLSKELIALLQNQGARVIVLTPAEDPLDALRTLLTAMEQEHEQGFILKASKRPAERNIEFTLPGLMVQSEPNPLLLSLEEIPTQLVPLLKRNNVKPVIFRIGNP